MIAEEAQHLGRCDKPLVANAPRCQSPIPGGPPEPIQLDAKLLGGVFEGQVIVHPLPSRVFIERRADYSMSFTNL